MSDTPDLSIVVPLKDEEPNVDPLHRESTDVLERLTSSYEVILIDDGSVNATFDRAAERHRLDSRVRVIRFTANFGQTVAFAARFAAARGRFIVTLDGDLQNDPHDIPRLLHVARDHDIVCGWRRSRHDDVLTRRGPSAVANYLIGIVTGIRLHDNGCSLKVFRADVVKPLRLWPGMHRYLPALASQLGGRVTEVVVNHRPRRFGRSKYGLSRTFQVLVALTRLRTLMQEAADQSRPAPPFYAIATELG